MAGRKAILDKTLVKAFPAGHKEGDPEAIRPDNAAWRARLRARRDAAFAGRFAEQAKLDAIRRKYSDDELDVKGTLLGESENGPVYAAGNPNNFGPGSPVEHAIIIGGSYYSSTATRDWINGDDNYDTVISPATAKNVLTVGSITDIDFSAGTFNISEFTGTGPTDDGRIKPDLVAVGQRNSSLGYGSSLFAAHNTTNTSYYNGILADSNGNVNLQGTSFAAPNVTGGLMLAEQRRAQLLPSAAPLLASTWRAAAVHTAFELGSPGPSYLTGWGSFNAEQLVSLLEDDESAGRGTLIKEFAFFTGVSVTFYATLPANRQGDITLAWSDPAGSPAALDSSVDP